MSVTMPRRLADTRQKCPNLGLQLITWFLDSWEYITSVLVWFSFHGVSLVTPKGQTIYMHTDNCTIYRLIKSASYRKTLGHADQYMYMYQRIIIKNLISHSHLNRLRHRKLLLVIYCLEGVYIKRRINYTIIELHFISCFFS